MARLYLLKLRLNICIDNDSRRGSSNSSTCNILSSCRVLIGVGIVTSEAFSSTEIIWFRLNSSLITVDSIKSRIQERTLYFNAASSNLKQASYLCVPSPPFCFSRKVTSKISRQYHASRKAIFADNQQKFDFRTTSALYMLNDWL